MTDNFFGITDTGRRRDKNEDTFIAEHASVKGLQLACVIDGVGGYSGGEVAASIARAVIIERLKKIPANITQALKEAIVSANEKIVSEKSSGNGNESMACVVSLAVTDLTHNKFYYAHVGDTRLYLLRDSSLIKISKDHSVVGFLEESGRLTEEEAMKHPRRNEINKALGFETAIDPEGDFIDAGESPFLPGDMLMLCSDGLSDMIGSQTIAAILSKKNSLAVKARELVDAANDAGGNDNITVVLVENNNQSKVRSTAIPAQKKNDITPEPAVTLVNAAPIEKTGSNKGLIAFLTILSLGLAFAFLFTLFKDSGEKDVMPGNQVMVKPARNAAEMDLINGLNDSAKIFALGNSGNPINITDAIDINQDSLHLMGNGNTLRSDSTYRGAGLVVSSSSKNILLDSLVFENFDVAIVVQKNNIVLRNVRFINCRVPIQYNMTHSDSVLSGRFADTIFTAPKF